MRILIATPLYPPDIAEPAPYVKELAARLKDEHSVTVLAYNHIPEEVEGVRIVTVPKSTLLPIRLFTYIYQLYRETRTADVVYVQNGPSVELPMILVAAFTRKPFILRLGDETALCHATESWWYRTLLMTAVRCAHTTITHDESSTYLPRLKQHMSAHTTHVARPMTRPEILPFEIYPTEAIEAYATSWNIHVRELVRIFNV